MAGSKREAKRIAKQKNNAGGKHVPRQPQVKSPPKQVPAQAADPETAGQNRVQWTAREIDHDVSGDDSCPWTWDMEARRATELLKFLDEISKKTWGEIQKETAGKRKKHHGQSLDTLCTAARARLKSQGFLDSGEEELFRFRLTGAGRLWGFKTGSIFRILWWDEDHQVYPTEKRNT